MTIRVVDLGDSCVLFIKLGSISFVVWVENSVGLTIFLHVATVSPTYSVLCAYSPYLCLM